MEKDIKTQSYTFQNEKSLEAFSGDFAEEYLLTNHEDRATLILLSGDLGSGKTTFTRMLSEALGVKDRVTSPTFVTEKRYDISNKKTPFRKLVHIDAYRFFGEDVSETLDFDETLENRENLILVEWPENITNHLENFDFKLNFEFAGENARNLELQDNRR